MKWFKKLLIIILVILSKFTFAQSMYDIDMMSAYVNAYGQMTQRAIEIRHAVQPYREKQCELFRNGYYKESIDLCLEVMDKYVYYVFDNKGIRDMECLAGEAAIEIKNYDLAITLFQRAIQAGESQANSKMLQLFYSLVSDARVYFNNRSFYQLWNVLTTASKTGYVNGEYFYYWGEYYESASNFKVAKEYYKKAKKHKYPQSIEALQRLKQRNNKD